MDEGQFPKIVSFVLRFVQDEPLPNNQTVYRGVIRHVQSDQTLTFSEWEDAQEFIEKFVQIKNPKIED